MESLAKTPGTLAVEATQSTPFLGGAISGGELLCGGAYDSVRHATWNGFRWVTDEERAGETIRVVLPQRFTVTSETTYQEYRKIREARLAARLAHE